MWNIILLLLMVFTNNTEALIGFDCSNSMLNVTTISLLDVGDCRIEREPLQMRTEKIILLEETDYTKVDTIQCKVRIQRLITNCGGFTDYSAVVDKGWAEYIHPISRDACRNLHTYGTLRLGDVTIDNLKPGMENGRPVTLAGKSNDDGDCTGAKYSDAYGTWSSVLVTGYVLITYTTQSARAVAEDDKVYFASGTTCQLSLESCVDSANGYSFWRTSYEHFQCHIATKLRAIWNGIANVTTSKEGTVYTVSEKEHSFSLKTKDLPVRHCGMYNIVKTEHPKLAIMINEVGVSWPGTNAYADYNMFAYVDSKFVYVERWVRTQMKDLYYNLLDNQCRQEKALLRTNLAMAATMPDEFAYLYTGRPGYMAFTAGEVIHMIQCVPVEVVLRQNERCYNQLPVWRGKNATFLTPRTHILVDQAAEVLCNVPLPHYFRLDQGWYKFAPKPIKTADPVILTPTTMATWDYAKIAELASTGIYTLDDITRMRHTYRFPMEKAIIIDRLASRLGQVPVADDGESYAARILSASDIESLTKSVWERTWGKFTWFGTFSAGIIGIFTVIHLFKTVADTLMHGYALHAVYGWSVHLLAALWSTLATGLLHERKRAQRSTSTSMYENTDDVTEGIEMEPSKPLYPAHLLKENQPNAPAPPTTFKFP